MQKKDKKNSEGERRSDSDPSDGLSLDAEIRNLKDREAAMKKIRSDLDSEFSSLLSKELSELEKFSLFSESVVEKLRKHYADSFPKKCNSCGRLYQDREQYLEETKRLRRVSTVYDDLGLQEYRNCLCGSTLVLWSQDRRDNSLYGIARRKLFDECVEKLSKLSQESSVDEIKERLREVFSRLAA